jgi:hypothetical protein
MAQTRTRDGDRTRTPSGSGGPIELVDLPDYGETDIANALAALVGGRPSGSGGEVSTSSGVFVRAAQFAAPKNKRVEIDEIAVAPSSNGAVRVDLAGRRFGPYSGAVDVRLPFDGAVLDPGDLVVVSHRSTDGNATETLYQLTGRRYE